ncbi:bifunctional O-acetylhomoserine aminocarboxypropyltransferase/cysteine synthase, partial [Xanthomonas citri pv. citri]|nr:bifunctional O-acetylhomoserine aminocarboxypropyltransferase/cysteine synthase [Xanthomonas citri pv. citri]
LHAGYTPKNGEPRALPIVQSTTFTYDSAESIGKLFDLEEAGFFYTRLANPTTNAVEEKIAALEGGVAAMCTASGQSAVFYALMNLLESGDHFIS